MCKSRKACFILMPRLLQTMVSCAQLKNASRPQHWALVEDGIHKWVNTSVLVKSEVLRWALPKHAKCAKCFSQSSSPQNHTGLWQHVLDSPGHEPGDCFIPPSIMQDSSHSSHRVKRGKVTHQHVFSLFLSEAFNCAQEVIQGPSPQHLALESGVTFQMVARTQNDHSLKWKNKSLNKKAKQL